MSGQGRGTFELFSALLALKCAFVAARGRRAARAIHQFGLVDREVVSVETVRSGTTRTDQRREHFSSEESQQGIVVN